MSATFIKDPASILNLQKLTLTIPEAYCKNLHTNPYLIYTGNGTNTIIPFFVYLYMQKPTDTGYTDFWTLFLRNQSLIPTGFSTIDVKNTCGNAIEPGKIYVMQTQSFYENIADIVYSGTKYKNTDDIYIQSHLAGNGDGNIILEMYYLRLDF